MTTYRWTSRDLEVLPDNDKQYEIVDGELYVSRQPHLYHQVVSGNLVSLLNQWSEQQKNGLAIFTPGVIFADDDDVVPDVIWISHARLAQALQPDGKLHSAPELVIEVLSPGSNNERRDREAKLKLYSRRGVLEYWIVSWQERRIEVYRREDAILKLASTLYEDDALQSPHLLEFSCPIRKVFAQIV